MMKKVLGTLGVGIYLLCATQSFALDLEWKTKANRWSLSAVASNT